MKTDPNAIGTAAEKAFHRHLTAEANVTHYRWPDAKGAIKKSPHSPQAYRGKIAPAPADFIAYDFRPSRPPNVLYEVKATTNKDGIPFSNFAPHQLALARKFTADMHDRGAAFFFVIHDARRDDWYAVPGHVVVTTAKHSGLLSWDDVAPYRRRLIDI